jgi:hypothetical protein
MRNADLRNVKWALNAVLLSVVVLMLPACGGSAVKINGSTVIIKNTGQSVTMEEFSLSEQSDDNSKYDKWAVRISCSPELESTIALDQSTASFFLTPIANVNANGIVILGTDGTGTGFEFQLPKGEQPLSYQVKIKDYVLTYDYEKKTWSYSLNDKDFKPVERIRI